MITSTICISEVCIVGFAPFARSLFLVLRTLYVHTVAQGCTIIDEKFLERNVTQRQVENLKEELRNCMLEKITELTDEEMEAITLTINLIFSGNFETIDENLAVIRLFAEALLLRQQCLKNETVADVGELFIHCHQQT